MHRLYDAAAFPGSRLSSPGSLAIRAWKFKYSERDRIIIISYLYSAFYHVNMFKCALQASTELTVERLRLSVTAAHKYSL